jgi:hypothetical protein
MPVTLDNLSEAFADYTPLITLSLDDQLSPDQQKVMGTLHTAAHQFAREILTRVPACADQQAAIRHVREALMTANAAVALKGLV